MAKTQGDHAVKGKLVVSEDGKFEKGLDSPYLEVIDSKQSGVAGGDFKGQNDQPGSTAWKSRDLTFVVQNDFATSIFSGTEDLEGPAPDPDNFGVGQITLERGRYYTEISAPALNVNEHVARLADVTDDPGNQADTVILGTTEFAPDTELWETGTDLEQSTPLPVVASAAQTRSFVTGQFALSAQRTLEIQHLAARTQDIDGFGSDGAFYEVNNVFTIVKMWQVREDI
jgi:hypothetical protein